MLFCIVPKGVGHLRGAGGDGTLFRHTWTTSVVNPWWTCGTSSVSIEHPLAESVKPKHSATNSRCLAEERCVRRNRDSQPWCRQIALKTRGVGWIRGDGCDIGKEVFRCNGRSDPVRNNTEQAWGDVAGRGRLVSPKRNDAAPE